MSLPPDVPFTRVHFRMGAGTVVHRVDLDVGYGITTVCGQYAAAGAYHVTDEPVTCRTGEPVLWLARPHPALVVVRLAWRFRHELAPVYAALGLAVVAGIAHDYAPMWWPLGLLLGGGITAAAWQWRADRRIERAYVLAVGAGATVWTTAA